MRIIPKRSKMKSTIYKSWGIKDIIVAFLILVIVVLILMSNLPGRFVVAITIAVLAITLFIPTGPNTVFYTDALQFVKFGVGKKKFTSKKDIDRLMPFKDISEKGVIEYDGYFGVVIEVGQKEFGIEDEFQQNLDIDSLAATLKYVDDNQSIDIVKIDRPVNFDAHVKTAWDKMHNVDEKDDERRAVKQMVYYSRVEQIDAINNIEKIYCPFYYIVIYDSDEHNCIQTAEAMIDSLNQISLVSRRLDAYEAAIFIKYSFTRNFDEREAYNLKREELAEWLSFVFASRREDVHVQNEPSVFEAQRRIESAESAARAFDAFDRYGGAERVYAVMEQYRKAYPDNYELLRKVGNAGLPGAKSLEALAGEYYYDVKTLRRREAAIAEDIASGVVYGDGTSFSLVHDPDKDKRNERNRWRGTEKINSP